MPVYPIAAHGVQQWDTPVENGEEVQWGNYFSLDSLLVLLDKILECLRFSTWFSSR